MKRDLDTSYLAEFPDVLNQVVSEVFGEPLMVAGVHAGALFGADKIAMAALAGCTARLGKLESVAALTYMEWLALEKSTTKFKRLTDSRLRKRHADLKELGERTVALIENYFESGGKIDVFAAAMVEQMNSS
ncbi:MAG: hypothetical protein Q8N51_17545 [Gammaproteobacteria bacterium]|nr:hypothetical protein [Gammaproteobacteria bacterium]